MSRASQNGWPALEAGSPLLYTWTIPARNGTFRLRLRNGSAGFLLAMQALWESEVVEDATLPGVPDDWGHANRTVRGYARTISNHASGTAYDVNATRHPLGRRGTYSRRQLLAIRDRLRWKLLAGCIRSGTEYHNRPDEMHREIDRPLATCERVARLLMRTTPNGRRIIAANPSQRAVILR